MLDNKMLHAGGISVLACAALLGYGGAWAILAVIFAAVQIALLLSMMHLGRTK